MLVYWRLRLIQKYKALLKLAEQLPANRFLTIPFERFVLDHDRAAQVLCDYLGLEIKQRRERRFFPEQSRQNIGIGENEQTRAMLAPHQEKLTQLVALRSQLSDPLSPV